MKIATTVHKEGFDQYGHRWIDGMKNWPDGEFVMYSEGFDSGLPNAKRIEDLQRLKDFKAKHANYVAPSWEFDIVRFSNKVFAAYDAFYEASGLCIWLDADCVTYKPIPQSYVTGLLPGDCYMAMFKRAGYHTETGLWVLNADHPEHQAFMDTWVAWFESGQFKTLAQWHDCTTLDATVKLFERDGRIKTHNLSGAYTKDMHPMAKADIARFIDHTKGGRKSKGRSPENKFRAAA